MAGPAQALSLSLVVSDRSCEIRPGDSARPANARAPISGPERCWGRCPRPSEGEPQLHNRDSPASFLGAAPPAFLGRQMTISGQREEPAVRATECALRLPRLFAW